MRYLGIDYGKKRVGLAVSDETGTMAFPREVIKNDGQLLAQLEALVEKEGIGAIVIGHSKTPAGVDNPLQADITELVTDLTLHVGVPVHLEPEQFSTQAAIAEQGRTELTDASAAAVILNRFLEKQK